MAEKKTFRDSLLRAVALLGLLLVLLLGAWGIILLALNLPAIAGSVGTNITSIFTGGMSSPSTMGESLSVNAPSSATSGQPFTLSWQDANANGARAYSVAYSCESGLSVKAPTASGQYQAVSCNTPFNYTNANGSMPLIASVTGAPISAAFTVSAMTLDTGMITASNSATVTIARATNTTTTTGSTSGSSSTGSTQTTYVPAATRPALYGYADLAVRIVSVSPASYTGSTVVKFEISNVGTNIATGGWNFTAQLPLNPVYTYTAATQQALYPGDKIVYTLTYTNPQSQYNQVCTQQYPYNCTSGYNNTYPYQNQQPCYSYNGYQNVQVACVDADGNPIVYNNQNYNTNYNTTYPYNGYGYQGGLITITADPQGLVYDLNRANNTASIAAPAY